MPESNTQYTVFSVHLDLHKVGADWMTAIIHVSIPSILLEGKPYYEQDQMAINRAKGQLRAYITDTETCRGVVANKPTEITGPLKEGDATFDYTTDTNQT